MKITSFETKPQETEGVWVDIGEGASLLIARLNNPKYLNHIRSVSRKKGSRFGGRVFQVGDDDAQRDLTCRAFAKHVLLGWKGIDDADGKPLVYSEETAYRYLRDYDKFFWMVSEIAMDAAVFEAQEEADSSKNSVSSSGGGSNGEST